MTPELSGELPTAPALIQDYAVAGAIDAALRNDPYFGQPGTCPSGMRRCRFRIPLGVASISLAFFFCGGSALRAQAASCESFKIANIPWISSAVAVPSVDSAARTVLMLVNARAPEAERLISLDTTGQPAASPFPTEVAESDPRHAISAIARRQQGGVVLERGFSRVESFSEDLQLQGVSVDLYTQSTEKVKEKVSLLSLYSNWTVTAEDSLVGFGAVYKPQEDRPTLGVVRASRTENSEYLDAVELLQPSTAHSYYLLGHPYFATSSAGTFYLDFSKGQTQLRRVGVPSDPTEEPPVVNALPPRFRGTPPSVPAPTGRASTKGIFEGIEKSKLPVGLYALPKEPWLYLLTREIGQSGTLWLLYRLDPIKLQYSEPIQLPNSGSPAHHVTLILAEMDSFFVVERGAVKEDQVQENKVLLKIPRHYIDDTSKSPFLWNGRGGSSAVVCAPR